MNEFQAEDVDFTPPPLKRLKTEEMKIVKNEISLSAFLTTPHQQTKNCSVQVHLHNLLLLLINYIPF